MVDGACRRHWGSRAAVVLVLALAAWTWWTLTIRQPLAPPDYYRYHADSERLWRGESMGMHLPPLYPLLTGVSGRALSLVMPRRDAFILAGKILSLLAALGVFFAFRVLAGAVAPPGWALLGTGLLLLSPMVMPYMALPLTDLPFLALMLGALAALYRQKWWAGTVLALLATGVRFEGLLLLLIVVLLRIPLRRRRWLLWIPLGLLAAVDLLFLAARYSPRLVQYLGQWFLGTSPLLWGHPLFLLRVVTGNLLFFLPTVWPQWIQLGITLMLLLLVAAGAAAAWRIHRRATLAVLLFLLGMVTFKGYILFEGSWRMHTRRLLPVYVLSLALAVMGAGAVARWLAVRPKLGRPLRVGVPVALALVVVLETPAWPWWVVLILFPLAWSVLGSPGWGDARGLAAAGALAVVLAAGTGIAFRHSLRLVQAMPNPAGVAVARWIDGTSPHERGRMLMMVNPDMVRYYLKQPAEWLVWNLKPENDGDSPGSVWTHFQRRLRKERIDRLVVDRYLPATPRRGEVSIKGMIWRKWRDPGLFRVIRLIRARGRLQALVLAPQSSGRLP